MDTLLIVVLIVVLIGVAGYYSQNRTKKSAAVNVDDAKAEARRWIDRLGGQVLSLDGRGDAAATQALADASERFNSAGAQIEQATSAKQAQLAQQTAYEGLYYVRAARTTLGMDPGPEIPPIPGQQRAGAVTEDRRVDVEGHGYEASPNPGDRTSHYYPGGEVAGKPVPRGWYSEPWWRPALVAGAWGVGSVLVASTLFAGMAGVAYAGDGGAGDNYQDGGDGGDGDGGDAGSDGGDAGGDSYGADAGGDTAGGYDGGGYDGGSDFGGGDFGGGDFGGGGDF